MVLGESTKTNIIVINIDKMFTIPFETPKELSQDCSTSPTFFNIYCKNTLITWKRNCHEIEKRIVHKY